MRPDDELLRCYADSQAEEAFTELVQRYVNVVYTSALRQLRGDTHRAEDVTQAVFTLVAQKAPKLIGHPNLIGWLYLTTRFVVRDAIRQERRQQWREHAAAIMEHDFNPTGRTDPAEPLCAQLDDAMQRLNDRDRRALLLRFFEGRAFAEIGQRMSVSEDAARMRVDRAVDKLRQLLARRGITSTASALGAALMTEGARAAPAHLAAKIASAAASATTGSAATGGFIFMATTKTIGTAGIVAVLALGISVYETQAARDVRITHEALAKSVAALDAESARAETKSAQLQKEIESTPPSPTGKSAEVASPVSDEIKRVENAKAHLYFNSEWRDWSNNAHPFIASLGLPPEQMAKYSELASRELAPSQFANWFGNYTIEQYSNLLRDEWKRETRALIGDAAFAQVERLMTARNTVLPLNAYLANSGLPLESAQAKRLLTYIANHPNAWRTGSARVTKQLIDESAGILSTSQVAAWHRLDTLNDSRAQLVQQARAAEKARRAANGQ